MNEFQKIAIGLLGLTHPEMFAPRPKPEAGPPLPSEDACAQNSTRANDARESWSARLIRACKFTLTALAIGSRSVPFDDNRQLRRDLGAYSRLLRDPQK
jgi:hypothetical protein